ncbi:MAG TPA: DUF1697 domain-containing protein [Candidatus Limnocylindrales bacterium]
MPRAHGDSLQVSLLRGINVGGANRIGMAPLRALYESAGCRDVVTHLQSGNVVLRDERSPNVVSEAIEAAIRRELGLTIRVLGRTHTELRKAIEADPFPAADRGHRHVVFLSGEPKAGTDARLAEAATGNEAAVLVGREVHLLLPDGMGRTKLSQALVERRLGVVATARNWRTVTRLLELSAPDAAS